MVSFVSSLLRRPNRGLSLSETRSPRRGRLRRKSTISQAENPNARKGGSLDVDESITSGGGVPVAADSFEAILQADRKKTARAYRRDLEKQIRLRQEAPKRWNSRIMPDDEEFRNILDTFHAHLADSSMSLVDIFGNYFTNYEQTLLLPASKKQNPVLARLQSSNRKRYNALLESPRFRDWSSRADLGFKLTLAYFGLPVAPITIDFDQQVYLDVPEDDVVEDPKDTTPYGGHLRFLSKYAKRLYDDDRNRYPDEILESYYGLEQLRLIEPGQPPKRLQSYPFSFSLRGGGDADDNMDDKASSVDDSETWPDDDNDASMEFTILGESHEEQSTSNEKKICLRGGEETTEKSGFPGVLGEIEGDLFRDRFGEWGDVVIPDTPHELGRTDLERDSDPKVWLPLYGYQGIVWFDLNTFATFVDAVDRLLGVGTRSGINYTIFMYRRGDDYQNDSVRRRWMNHNDRVVSVKGEGDYSGDFEGFEWLKERLDTATKKGTSPYDWAIFVKGPGGKAFSWEWEPAIDRNDIFKFCLDWVDGTPSRPDVAYLRVPTNLESISSPTVFGPWMASILRLLTPGRLSGRPGRPEIPDAYFSLAGCLDPAVEELQTYGGLSFPPQAWNDIQEQWKDGIRRMQFRGMYGKEPDSGLLPSKSWKIFLPGYNLSINDMDGKLDHDKADDPRIIINTIKAMVSHSMTPQAFADLAAIELWTPGDSLFLSGDKTCQLILTWPNAADSQDKDPAAIAASQALLDVSSRLKQWRQWLTQSRGLHSFPQFITIRPRFQSYTFFDAEHADQQGVVKPLEDLQDLELGALHQIVQELWTKGTTHSVPYDRDNVCVQIQQGSPTLHKGGRDHNIQQLAMVYRSKPSILVTPRTREHEWNLMRRLIVDPNLYISLVLDQDATPEFDDEGGFGFTDLYLAPDAKLYRTSGGIRPTPVRYFDWQLWDKHALSTFASEPYGFKPGENPKLKVLPTRKPSGNAPASGHTQTRKAQRASKPGNVSESTIRGPTVPAKPKTAPQRSVHPSDQEMAHAVRKYSYNNPLSVQDYRTIPINAPPIEQILNLGNPSLPAVTLAVLTPSEVRRLQVNHYNMRNLALDRIQKCPFKDCDEAFSMLEAGQLHRHVADAHTFEKCNFCDTYLYKYWTLEQRMAHFDAEHRDVLSRWESGPADHGTWNPSRTVQEPDFIANSTKGYHQSDSWKGLVSTSGKTYGRPSVCPYCHEDITRLSSYEFLQHAESDLGDLPDCPLCDLNWARLGWDDDYAAKIAHMDDHIVRDDREKVFRQLRQSGQREIHEKMDRYPGERGSKQTVPDSVRLPSSAPGGKPKQSETQTSYSKFLPRERSKLSTVQYSPTFSPPLSKRPQPSPSGSGGKRRKTDELSAHQSAIQESEELADSGDPGGLSAEDRRLLDMVKFVKGYATDQDAMDYVERKKRRMQDPNYRPNPGGHPSDDDSDSVGISAEEVGKEAAELGGPMPPRDTGSRTEVESAEDLARYEPVLGRKPDFELDPNPPYVVFKDAPATEQDASATGELASQFAETTPASVVGSMQRGFGGMYASPGYRRIAAQQEEDSGDSDSDEEWEDDW